MEDIPVHVHNLGYLILPSGNIDKIRTCWCHISKHLGTSDILTESLSDKDQGEVMTYRRLYVKEEDKENKNASAIMKKSVKGPIFCLRLDGDLNDKFLNR